MLPTIIILSLVFLFVVFLFIAVVMMWRDKSISQMEDRLNALTGKGDGRTPSALAEAAQILAAQKEEAKGLIAEALARRFNLTKLFEQADVSMTISAFLAICVATGVGAGAIASVVGLSVALSPIVGLLFGALPVCWLLLRRRKRLRKFAAQLPEALELVARALRAGHSLAAGFRLVATEASQPISGEFGRVFEEQNLGIPFEEALDSMTERVPNLDLKFFVTAVVLQRQTGGDLAEILDKIGHLIRERFKIWGQVQALTGEGRLSGIVLLALPPLLFVAVYRMNPDYLMVLFTDDLGKKMLIGGVLMQLLGALVIRKIVNIRV